MTPRSTYGERGRQETEPEIGNFTVEKVYDPPKTAIVRGRLVKVGALGNAAGHSPAWQIFDQGQPEIVSFNELVMLDLDTIAPSNAQIMDLLRNLTR